jgi:hypothetical protein
MKLSFQGPITLEGGRGGINNYPFCGPLMFLLYVLPKIVPKDSEYWFYGRMGISLANLLTPIYLSFVSPCSLSHVRPTTLSPQGLRGCSCIIRGDTKSERVRMLNLREEVGRNPLRLS